MMNMNVEELIIELQNYDDDIPVVTPVYEIDHTQYYDGVHTVRFIAKGKEYNGRKAYRNFVVIDAVR